MSINISKYFWDLNAEAFKQTKKIFKEPSHPKFISRLVTLLSRCQSPKELFSLLSENTFIEVWPRVRSYWQRIERGSEFRDWWQSIYEQILQKYRVKGKKIEGKPSVLFLSIGRKIKEGRHLKGLSQSELALRVGIKQPDISKIEEGKKNITLETLFRLCKVLEIKKIDF